MSFITLLVFVLITFIVFIFLQIFLSKKDNRGAGLILPIITFCFALVVVLSIALDNYYGLPVLPIASASFIPTAVLLTIYAASRGNQNRRRALEKMSAQDLE